ncbi:helicase [Butyricicoccus sp. 1XD8-22]|nr:helicase [Butyricicoccus sp. 1XD8-22]
MPSFEEQTAFFEAGSLPLTEQEIDSILLNGTGFENGKFRVSQYFSGEHTEKEKIKFLAKEYGIGGCSWTFQDGSSGFVWYDSKGISVRRSEINFAEPEFHFSWTKAAARVNELVISGRYLTEEEKAAFRSQQAAEQTTESEPEQRILTVREIHEQFLPIIRNLVLEDAAYQNACKNSDRENAYLEGNEAVKRAVLTVDDTVFQRLYADNPTFHRRLHQDVLNGTYPMLVQPEQEPKKVVGTAAPQNERSQEKSSPRDPLLPAYLAGDTVFLEDTAYEITEVGMFDVQLLDPHLKYPVFRSESKEHFERLLLNDTRNGKITEFFAADISKADGDDLRDALTAGLFSDRDKAYISGWIRSGMGNTPLAARLSETFAGNVETMTLETGEICDYRASTVGFEIEIHDKFNTKRSESWVKVAKICRALYQQELYGFAHEPQPPETADLEGKPHYKEGDPVIIPAADREISGEIGYIGDKEVRVDTSPYSWSHEMVERGRFEDGLRKDERNAELFAPPAQNFHITDDNLGAGGPKAKFAANLAAINLLKTLESESRPATMDEQETLSRYVGWGGLQQAFDETSQSWSGEYRQLRDILTEEEYTAARGTVLNAHFTSPTVVKAIYECVENMGFRTGNILEPSMGVGNFFGLLPDGMEQSRLYGVELDSITGRIAQKLYPDARIQVTGFENTQFPSDFFDLAVGNVPFGQYKINDPKYDKHNFHIHDYFFAKTLDLVRPGGVVAFVTSRYTMDKKNSAVRRFLAQRADLLGAVRLPNTAFKSNAGTEVTTDILFLQKRDRILDIESEWVSVGQTADGFTVNQYFVEHPEMILGTLTLENRQYGNEDLTCAEIPGSDLSELLRDALRNIRAEIPIFEVSPEQDVDMEGTLPADPDVRNFSYTLVDNRIYFRENSVMSQVETSKTGESRIRGLIEIRDAARALIDAQMANCSDQTLHELQGKLNQVYDSYTAKYGLLNSRGNSTAFSDDASYPLLCSLEDIDDEGKLKRKADIFTKRTIRQSAPVTHAETSVEALTISIGERARVDLDFMSQLLNGKPQEEITSELKGVIFENPQTENWETSDEYLSGEVRQKLATALYYAEKEPERWAQNVESLKAVQPKDLDASEISVRLGARWIPAEDVSRFAYETFGTPTYYQRSVRVLYSAATDTWRVEGKRSDLSGNASLNVTFGTERINAYEILEQSLNLKEVRIFDTKINEENKEIRVLNKKETILAQQKQQAVRNAFRDWVFKDPERRERLAKKYNELYNGTRPRIYDGSHIRFVGMNPEVQLWKHQQDAIARTLYGGNTLLAHVVGAGKTYTMAAAAMEAKRLGLCHKSMFVVPNHLVQQWAGEFLQLYPSANLLITTKKDFETANRKKFCARIATGDYDAIVIGHSQFEKIPISAERQAAMLQHQIEEITDGIQQVKYEHGERFTIKQMEYTRKNLEAKLKVLEKSQKKDTVVTFEELGVDRLFVDEGHFYKNLFLYTKMRNVAGIGQTEAQKSTDLYNKCRYIDELTGGRGLVVATGTPISNSMSELYTMMRYLQHDLLEQKGLAHFDCWAAAFGETVTAMELSPEGTGYRMKTRFAKFNNLPELINLWREVTDIQTADMLNLPAPKANYHTQVSEPTELQKQMVQELGERAEEVRSGSVDPTRDNMLRITNDGRNLALDQRQIDPSLPDDPNSKINVCVDNVFRIWEESAEQKGTQLIFSDLSTPKPDAAFSAYDDIKGKLVARGIPENEIAFIHDAKTDVQKADLFAKVRAGQVRVLLGSTVKMGAGTNVQRLLVALHHLDVPWRPSDIEQREGRIIRQGNLNPEVDIYRYVTKSTFDSYSWQLIEQKQKFIGQVLTSKSPVRSCEDVDSTALSYAEIKALAAGNPEIKEMMDLEVQVSQLRLLKSNHQREQYRLEDKLLKHIPDEMADTKARVSALEKDFEILKSHLIPDSEKFSITIDQVQYTNRETAGEAILQFVNSHISQDETQLGSYKGFSLYCSRPRIFEKGSLFVVGAMRYQVELGESPQGITARIDNMLRSIPQRLEKARDTMVGFEQQIDEIKVAIGKPFPQENELSEKEKRLVELTAKLRDDQQPTEIVDNTPPAQPPSRKRLRLTERGR